MRSEECGPEIACYAFALAQAPVARKQCVHIQRNWFVLPLRTLRASADRRCPNPIPEAASAAVHVFATQLKHLGKLLNT